MDLRRLVQTLPATIVCAIALVVGPVGATSVLPLELPQLVAGSRDVVHVRCIATESVADTTVGVATVTQFVILDRAKGGVGTTLVLRQPGGTLGTLAVDFRLPRFHVGDEYVLFVPAPSTLGFASPLGLAQGMFAISDTATGKEVGNGRDFAALLRDIELAKIPTGTRIRLTLSPKERSRIALDDFMTIVRARAATP
ncbi:MAG: hypothetical protein ABI777_10825 [Betaproteobacteria bacterium]